MATSLSRTLRNVSKYKVFIDHTTGKSTSSKKKRTNYEKGTLILTLIMYPGCKTIQMS